MANFKYSIVIPVYNRPDEIEELLYSLSQQTAKNIPYEVVIIEDGSSLPCKDIVDKYANQLKIQYYTKDNSGCSDSRNYGVTKAQGEWVILTDSDCMFSERYLELVDKELAKGEMDVYGGPDTSHPSFNPMQKAVSYAMTAPISTGGIRNKKNSLGGKYFPRAFNYGIKRELYLKYGGTILAMPGDDTDLSIRLYRDGARIGFIADAIVYHKRRVSFKKYFKQVFWFARARVKLNADYPETSKLVYWLPTLASLFALALVVCSFICIYALTPIIFYALLVLIDSTIRNKNIKIGIMSVITVAIQHIGYGTGFVVELFEHYIRKKPFIGSSDYRKKKSLSGLTQNK